MRRKAWAFGGAGAAVVIIVVALVERHAAAQAGRPQVPLFEPDPLWSQALPNKWVTGQVGGLAARQLPALHTLMDASVLTNLATIHARRGGGVVREREARDRHQQRSGETHDGDALHRILLGTAAKLGSGMIRRNAARGAARDDGLRPPSPLD